MAPVYYISDGGHFSFKAPDNQWASFRALAQSDAGALNPRLEVVVLSNGAEIVKQSLVPENLEKFYKVDMRFEFDVTESTTVIILVQRAEWSRFQVLEHLLSNVV